MGGGGSRVVKAQSRWDVLEFSVRCMHIPMALVFCICFLSWFTFEGSVHLKRGLVFIFQLKRKSCTRSPSPSSFQRVPITLFLQSL
jgi:hypothetical protein